MEQRTLIFGVTLVALAAAIWWFQRTTDTGPEEAQGSDQSPDYIVEDFKVTNMDASGKPHRRLVAEKMMHYAHSDESRLVEPIVTVFERDNPVWRTTSETARVTSGQELIEMQGQVIIDQAETETTLPIHLETSNLVIHSKRDFAETAQAVSITSGEDSLKGVGMQLWFKPPMKLQLLSQTRAHYRLSAQGDAAQ